MKGESGMGTRISKYKVELVRESAKVYEVELVNNSRQAYKAFNAVLRMDVQPEEVFAMLVFDIKGTVLGAFEVSRGGIDCSIVSMRELFKRVLLLNGHGIIVAHNHPSGYTNPSKEDIDTTNRLKECCKLMGIGLRDHLIIGENGFFSFREDGLL